MSDPMQEWCVELAIDRLVVVSPHFDDAVLGAGQLLAAHPGATVITVMGGRPDRYPAEVDEWHALGGFGPTDDRIAVRRDEDRRALAEVGASPVWLDHVEQAYLAPADRPTAEAIAPSLEAALVAAAPTAVAFPFGLGNPDHGTTHEAVMLVRERHPDLVWLCYQDAGYRHIPGMLAWRISSLFRSGVWPTPAKIGRASCRERV